MFAPWWKRWFGNRSEREAVDHLKRLGYRILTRNYLCKGGELDIVALDGETIVFVEVRSTSDNDMLRATLSVGPDKQKRIIHAATHYLQRHKLLDRACRFDVVSISWPPGQRRPMIGHYPNAFESGDRFQMFT